ncbi:hypothetical protein E2C01_076242 [Portunus trituberculatus]|uniref:Uncharacterized protein n=1 Tax=Portunus trituberculatus TaxID=210409 RepID=A0A5B7II28_PORTR|nr:hypothetical protein [Portunus trituberculatus]
MTAGRLCWCLHCCHDLRISPSAPIARPVTDTRQLQHDLHVTTQLHLPSNSNNTAARPLVDAAAWRLPAKIIVD